MKVSQNLQKSYPTLATWINLTIPLVKNKKDIFAAFLKYSEQTDDSALRVGTDPKIDFRKMPDSNGQYDPKFPDTVFISDEICDKYEKSEKDRKDPRMILLLESTILHEIVHWGDDKDNKDQAGEEGKDFEVAAYGRDIDRYW